MSGFEAGLVALAVAVAALTRYVPRAGAAEPGRDWLTPLVFVASLVHQIVRHQLMDPGWIPHGTDWDQWVQSAMAFSGKAPYPPSRWPLYGSLVAAVHAVTPGALFIKAQLVSHAATAAAVAGLFRLAWPLVGRPGALAVAALAGTLPVVLELGEWSNAYPLWAASMVWTVTAMAEGARTRRLGWWVAAGLCLGLQLAAMEKGLGPGLLLGPLLVGLLIWSGGRRLRNALGAVIPFVALAVIYAVFPHPLMTLEAKALSQQDDYCVVLDETPAGRAPPHPFFSSRPAPERYTEGGYVFGKSMGPISIFRALRTVATMSTSQQFQGTRDESLAILRGAFPSVGIVLLLCMALAPAAGLWFQRRRWRVVLPGWLGLCVIMAANYPALISEPDPRFLLPAFTVAAIFVATPAIILGRGWAGPWRWAILAVPLLALLPGSPWREGDQVRGALRKMEVPGHRAVALRHELARAHPGVALEVIMPLRFGILALDGREGTQYPEDPRFHKASKQVDPRRHLLIMVPPPGHPERMPAGLEHCHLTPRLQDVQQGRAVLGRWALEPPGAAALLLGPRK